MSARIHSSVAVALALIALLASAPSASAAQRDKPKATVVLVHGAWADSSSWPFSALASMIASGMPSFAACSAPDTRSPHPAIHCEDSQATRLTCGATSAPSTDLWCSRVTRTAER